MAEGDVFLTRQGFENLSQEHEKLKTTKRREISQAIEKARLMGDLRENAEYTAAKEAQALNEKRIAELEQIITHCRLIEDENIESDKVLLGARVKLKNLDDGEFEEYLLVSEAEADFSQNKISVTSPLGKAFLGLRQGEKVDVKVPSGTIRYEILEVSR